MSGWMRGGSYWEELGGLGGGLRVGGRSLVPSTLCRNSEAKYIIFKRGGTPAYMLYNVFFFSLASI